jgi:senataxin
MHPEIASFPSREFYEGRVENGSTVEGDLRTGPWSADPSGLFSPYLVIDVPGVEARVGANTSLFNELEEQVAVAWLKLFRKRYPNEFKTRSFGVISFNKQQVLN